MTPRSVGLAALLGLSIFSPACWAVPPQINGTVPFGAQKGAATELTISGANLAANPQLIAPFAFAIASPAAAGSDAGNWKLKLTVAPETPIGVYPIRLRTDEGLSNPFLFSVGQLPQVLEKEDNSTFETAQVIPPLAVVEGQAAGNDVDYYRFPGKKGQRIVVDAQCARIGSGVDPSIRLTTAARAYIASADDSAGLLTDARLFAVLPEDTEYVIELSDSRYQGGGRPVYRLVVGPIPVAEEVYPIGGRQGETVGLQLRGGTLGGVRVVAATLNPAPGSEVVNVRATNQMIGLAAGSEPVLDVESLNPIQAGDVPEVREPADAGAPSARAAVPVTLNGRIDPAGDEDRFALVVTPGQKLRIEVEAAENGSALDGVLQVLGNNNAVLATADDTTIPPQGGKRGRAAGIVSPDPSLDFTVPSGVTEITLALRDLETRGGIGFPYRIVVSPIVSAFELALNDSQVSIPRNASAAIGATVVRKGYNGPITLTVANPPPGLTVRPGTIAEGQLLGSFSVSASPDAPLGVVNLDVVGQAQGPGGPITSHALKHLVFAQQGTFPTNTVTLVGLAASTAVPPAITLEAPSSFEVVHGFGAAIPVKVSRTPGSDTALAVTPLPLPPGLAIPAATIAAKATEGNVPVNAAVETPLGAMSIALVAKGKVANVEQSYAVPSVTLNVVRPAAVELASPAIEVKAGSTFELKGKVVRKGPFKEPVTVKVNGLPAGLKADPVTVPPDKAEFTVAVVADAKAASASAGCNVALAFQVNKKDYPTPPTALAVKVVPAK